MTASAPASSAAGSADAALPSLVATGDPEPVPDGVGGAGEQPAKWVRQDTQTIRMAERKVLSSCWMISGVFSRQVQRLPCRRRILTKRQQKWFRMVLAHKASVQRMHAVVSHLSRKESPV